MNEIKIFIVDHHPIVIDGIVANLTNEIDLQIIGSATTTSAGIEGIKQNQPDVVITDLSFPSKDGIQLIQNIHTEFPRVAILVFSMHENEEHIISAIDAGAKGYLSKSVDKSELIEGIRTVYDERTYFSKSLAQNIIGILINRKIKPSRKENKKSPLTKRQKEILKNILNGLSNREIGTLLSISSRTVDNHRYNIMQKLKVKNTAELIRLTIEKKLVES